MSDIKKKIQDLKNIIDPYQKKFSTWYKKDKNAKKFIEVITPYKNKFFDFYKKSNRNKNIVRVGGAVLILILGKSILGGGTYTAKTSTGYKVTVEKKDVFCRKGRYYGRESIDCTANGIAKDLTGNKIAFSRTNMCKIKTLEGDRMIYSYQKDSIPCAFAKKKGLI